jgi:hypothetical protein
MKKYLILMVITIFVIVSKAQIYTQFDVGYSLPIYEKNDTWTDEIIGSREYSSHKKSINFSAFAGAKMNIKAGYLLKNKFQFEFGFSYFNNYKFQISDKNRTIYDSLKTEPLGTPDPYYHLIEEVSYSSKYYSFNPSIAYVASVNKFSFTFLVGTSFRYVTIYKDFNGEIKTNKSDLTFSTSNTYEYYSIINEYFPSDLNIVVYTGLGVSYNFTDRISMAFNIDFPLYSPEIILPDKKTKYYSKFEVYENEELTYNIEETEEEELDNPDNFSFNTKIINLSLGIRYTFTKNKSE